MFVLMSVFYLKPFFFLNLTGTETKFHGDISDEHCDEGCGSSTHQIISL